MFLWFWYVVCFLQRIVKLYSDGYSVFNLPEHFVIHVEHGVG